MEKPPVQLHSTPKILRNRSSVAHDLQHVKSAREEQKKIKLIVSIPQAWYPRIASSRVAEPGRARSAPEATPFPSGNQASPDSASNNSPAVGIDWIHFVSSSGPQLVLSDNRRQTGSSTRKWVIGLPTEETARRVSGSIKRRFPLSNVDFQVGACVRSPNEWNRQRGVPGTRIVSDPPHQPASRSYPERGLGHSPWPPSASFRIRTFARACGIPRPSRTPTHGLYTLCVSPHVAYRSPIISTSPFLGVTRDGRRGFLLDSVSSSVGRLLRSNSLIN